MKEFFGGLNIIDEEERIARRRYWLRLAGWVVFAGLVLVGVKSAVAEPMFQVRQGDVVITLHSEECALKEVSNLPRRATWTEGGKVYEGCFGVQPAMEAVMMYFVGDKSVAVAPVSIFQKVVGA